MIRWPVPAMLLVAITNPETVLAEPYLATREGYKCLQCHVNPTGGGMRNAFGALYAQTVLPVEALELPDAGAWMDPTGRFLVGGDLRASATYTHVPNQDAQNAFETNEVRLYAMANAIPERLAIYIDQQMSPASSNLEAYARLWLGTDRRYYLKAGQMFLPYGLRLQDDSAYIRTVPGINFATPDKGVELGMEVDSWTAQLAVSNGTAGATENNPGKQVSLRAEFVQPLWRAGASFNFNDAIGGQRLMQNVFAGVRTGSIAWLAEADLIRDDSFATGERRLGAGLLEANWNYQKGHNLKLGAEYFEPDRDLDEDEQARYSLVWEYTPFQFLQVRAGGRFYEGIPQSDLQNRRQYFLELHGFF